MCQCDLPVFVLKDITSCSLKNSDSTSSSLEKTSSVLSQCGAASSCFNANHLHVIVVEKFIKEADCIASATNTREQIVGQPLFQLKNLSASLLPYHTLKIANHHRIGMR